MNAVLTIAAATALMVGFAAEAAAKPENGRTFGTWTVQCAVPPGKSEAQCVVAQTQIINESKVRLLTLEIEPAKSDLNVVALLPLGIALPTGVTMVWEDGSKTPMTLQRCIPDGCLATVTLPAAQQKALRSHKKLQIRAALPGMPSASDINVSLDGLDAAIDSLK